MDDNMMAVKKYADANKIRFDKLTDQLKGENADVLLRLADAIEGLILDAKKPMARVYEKDGGTLIECPHCKVEDAEIVERDVSVRCTYHRTDDGKVILDSANYESGDYGGGTFICDACWMAVEIDPEDVAY